MTLSFLIPFAISLIAGFIAYQGQEEIVTLFSTILAIISLVLTFVLAPWMVQILVLVAGLAGLRYFCDRHACQNSSGSR